uniref:ATP synthase complex subunit 8 n=1 Tax=Barbodes aurotaeniatus TaxID=1606549 RepID=A0A1E1FM66_9TELE|nr:ATP synthase F0 subunit 8 [Barbodes aurotaeniatus]BAV71605.1 ATPase subunit 8 [Barbodes aurotaeniatus]
MPQLNPDPWFMTLIFAWLIFLLIIPIKVLSHISPNEPSPVNTEKHKTGSWDWLW